MGAMVLSRIGQRLRLEERPDPDPGLGEIRVRVEACAVCRTDLHVVDGDLPNPNLPITPGHEIVGIVDALGAGVRTLKLGARVGVPWLGGTCGVCPYCASDRENLCDNPIFTGYTRDGGFATHVVADAACAFPLHGFDDPVAAAPLMCAGLIGWRSLKIAGEGPPDRPLRLRRGRSYPDASLSLAGTGGLRLHAGRRRTGAEARSRARRRLGRRFRRGAA